MNDYPLKNNKLPQHNYIEGRTIKREPEDFNRPILSNDLTKFLFIIEYVLHLHPDVFCFNYDHWADLYKIQV